MAIFKGQFFCINRLLENAFLKGSVANLDRELFEGQIMLPDLGLWGFRFRIWGFDLGFWRFRFRISAFQI